MKKSWVIFLLIFVLSGYCSSEKIVNGWYYNQSIGASWNPLGLLIDGKIVKRFALYPSKDGILWESGKMEFALRDEWTPVDNIFSFVYALQPIAFFNLTLRAGFFSQFNELGYGCFRLGSPNGKYTESTRKKVGYGDAYGYWLSLNPTIKLKIKNIVVVNDFAANSIKIDGTGYYHEVRSNLIHKVSDIDFVNDLFLFYTFNTTIMTGIRYRGIKVFKTDAMSHLLCLVSLITSQKPILKNTWLFFSIGAYPDEPLFKAREYVGILAGKEFSFGKRNTKNAK
jgi:hypothetical protein